MIIKLTVLLFASWLLTDVGKVAYASDDTNFGELCIAHAHSSKYGEDEDTARVYHFVKKKVGQEQLLNIKDCCRKSPQEGYFIIMNDIPSIVVQTALNRIVASKQQESGSLGLQLFSSDADLIPLFEHLSSCMDSNEISDFVELKQFEIPFYDFEFRNKLVELLGPRFEARSLH